MRILRSQPLDPTIARIELQSLSDGALGLCVAPLEAALLGDGSVDPVFATLQQLFRDGVEGAQRLVAASRRKVGLGECD